MRIMIVAGAFPPRQCGVGDYLAQLASALSKLENVKVAVLSTVGSYLQDAEKVEIFGISRGWLMCELPTLLRVIREWAPDILHIHYPSQGFYGKILPVLLPFACRLKGITVVQTWHEPWSLRNYFSFLLQRAGANGLIFVRPNYYRLMKCPFRLLVNKLPKVTMSNISSLPASNQTPEKREILRKRYLKGSQKLVVFFGFLYPSKGVELIFQIANLATDVIVVVGGCKDMAYLDRLHQVARTSGWENKSHFLGFISECEASDILSAADAVVLPFINGSGEWNTSVHGALLQGTLVITTSTNPTGDDAERNLYEAPIFGIDEMRSALRSLVSRRVEVSPNSGSWTRIAQNHFDFYLYVRAYMTGSMKN